MADIPAKYPIIASPASSAASLKSCIIKDITIPFSGGHFITDSKEYQYIVTFCDSAPAPHHCLEGTERTLTHAILTIIEGSSMIG